MNDDVETELRARVAELEAEVAALRAQLAASATGEPASSHLGLGEGERRNVTVLFADVSGFTALGEQLDAETYRAVVRDTMSILAECIVAEGGVVEKFIGDAVCAVFGAPVAHPDEPQRAARAALSMHEAMAARRASHPDLPPIGVHVGINTGLVIAGGMGDGSQFGVLGDAVNTAARLLDLARDGETFVAAETARRLRREFVLEDRGVHEVKGKAVPVAAFALLDSTASFSPRAESGVASGPVLGREVELDSLRQLASRVGHGRGAAVALVGPAGSGTSRLADALASELVERGWQARTPLEDFEAAEGQIVVVVDVDEEAGHAARLAELVRASAGSPVLWLFAGSSLPPALVALPGLELQRIGPLDEAATAELFERLLPGALDPEQRRQLTQLAEGNPLFVQEIAHALVDEGLVVETEDGWRAVGDVASCELPGSVSELVEARIDALPTAARAALQDAAVLGRRFRRDVLEQVSSAPAGLDAALVDLVEAGLVVPPLEDDGFWTLPSRLVRDVAYGSLLRQARQARHRAVHDVLATDPTADPDLLAHHAALGSSP